MSSTRRRSSSRSRTIMGYSLPLWRKNAAWVPPTLVRMLLATLVTLNPSSAAFGRSICSASSGRPSSRLMRVLRTSATLSSSAFASIEMRLASARSSPRISSESRLSPPPRSRAICWFPPVAWVVMITPGMTPASCLLSALAMSSLDRVRSDFGTSLIVALARLPPPPPPPPPPGPPPAPACVMMVSCSLTYSGMSDSSR